MAIDLNWISNDIFNSIVMPHGFNFVNDSALAAACFGKHFVVVTCYQQMRDGVSSPNFNLTIVSAQDEAVSGLHESHSNRMVWNVNGIVWWSLFVLTLVHTPTCTSLSVSTVLLLLWLLAMLLCSLRELLLLHPRHWLLTKSVPKLRGKVYKREKVNEIGQNWE